MLVCDFLIDGDKRCRNNTQDISESQCIRSVTIIYDKNTGNMSTPLPPNLSNIEGF